jgi:hypothetical protein
MLWLKLKTKLRFIIADFLFFVADVLSGVAARKHRDRKLVDKLYRESKQGLIVWESALNQRVFTLGFNNLDFELFLKGPSQEQANLRISNPEYTIKYDISVDDAPRLSSLFCLLRKLDCGEIPDGFKEFDAKITSTLKAKS